MAKDEQEQHNNSNSSNSNSNSNSEEEPGTPEIKSTNYEKQRDARIAANNARMESLGLRKMSISLMGTSQNVRTTRSSNPKSKRVVKKIEDNDDDHEYEPNYDDNGDGNGGSSSDDDDDDFEEEEETFVRRNRKSSAKKVKHTKANSGKQVSVSNPTDFPAFMDDDEALKQAIALSLKNLGETSDPQQTACSKEKNHDQFQEDNTKRRKRKLFTSRVQMSEDDLIIHFCQIDEVGKGGITLRDVERMAATHDFCWTDKELSDMIRCFDSDCDGKLTLDDFRNIAQRCNMLQPLQAHGNS